MRTTVEDSAVNGIDVHGSCEDSNIGGGPRNLQYHRVVLGLAEPFAHDPNCTPNFPGRPASFFSNAINASVDGSERMSTLAAAILKTLFKETAGLLAVLDDHHLN